MNKTVRSETLFNSAKKKQALLAGFLGCRQMLGLREKWAHVWLQPAEHAAEWQQEGRVGFGKLAGLCAAAK